MPEFVSIEAERPSASACITWRQAFTCLRHSEHPVHIRRCVRSATGSPSRNGLNAAYKAGFRTAFVRRPDEWGPQGPPDPTPSMAYEFIDDGFDALQRKLLARR
jgi:hypothetical protein